MILSWFPNADWAHGNLLKTPRSQVYFWLLHFFPGNFSQPQERRWGGSLRRFLINFSSYGVGWLRGTKPISARRVRTDIPGIVETWRTYGEKIGATRRILRLQIPPGRRPAKLHSRSQFAGTLDADDAAPTDVHYWHSLASFAIFYRILIGISSIIAFPREKDVSIFDEICLIIFF